MINPIITKKAEKWLNGNYDNVTKAKIRELIENNHNELTDAFYKNLEFGTGGLRGIMGVGTNRMNKYTVGMATQGLANYLKKQFPNENIKLAIAFDSRNNNTYFAEITADVLSANGIQVFIFDDIRPTPELSFAVRELNCKSGIVITASHNPKEYNGYKVYWDDGAQLINPHDINIINEVNKINNIDDVNFNANKSLISFIGNEIDDKYITKLKTLSQSPEEIKKHHDLKIVYTPIHGTGYKIVPRALAEFGFTNIIHVPEQDVKDGNFSTVKSPNPEESSTLEMAISKAKEKDAEIIMATDPDGDRVGIAVKKEKGEYILLNGNQTAAILVYYMLNKWKSNNALKGKEYIVKTIVTTELLKDISDSFNVESFDVLTGFKFIADIIRKNEGKKTFIIGGEESYGYLAGEFVRDKDAVIACCLIAETAAWAKEQGKTLLDVLYDIYLKYGLYQERLLSITKKGKDGAEEIQEMMTNFRNNTPKEINNSKLITIKDYQSGICYDLINNKQQEIKLPSSNVLQFFLEDGSKITIRPSGTEPKIKFYFSTQHKIERKEDIEHTYKKLEKRIDCIIESLELA